MRSVLTLIGVVIGVAAVIAVVSLINGANHYVATKVFNLGADVFGLAKQPSIITNVDDFLEFQKRKRLTMEDYEAVRDLQILQGSGRLHSAAAWKFAAGSIP